MTAVSKEITSSARVLFGAASPLAVDYEESLERCGLALTAAVSLGSPIRVLARKAVVAFEAITDAHRAVPFLPCAFTPSRRRELFEQATEAGFSVAEALIDPNAVIARSSRIGDGSFLNALAVIAGASSVGMGVVVNRSASVGHHCMLGDFCSIGPGAVLTGNVRVGEGAIIGAGSVILPGARIGDGAIVSAGSLVRKDVAPDTVVSGNPARPSKIGRAHV